MGFPGGSVGKESTCNAGDARDMGFIPGQEDHLEEGIARPTPVFLPGQFHGQRSLADYSPQGHNESDTTERLTLVSLSRPPHHQTAYKLKLKWIITFYI